VGKRRGRGDGFSKKFLVGASNRGEGGGGGIIARPQFKPPEGNTDRGKKGDSFMEPAHSSKRENRKKKRKVVFSEGQCAAHPSEPRTLKRRKKGKRKIRRFRLNPERQGGGWKREENGLLFPIAGLVLG